MSEAPKPKPKTEQARYKPGKEYEYTKEGLLWWRPTNERGAVTARQAVRLSNFNAEILAEMLEDDGAEQTLSFKLLATIGKRKPREIIIPARDFDAMGWITPQLGARAIIYPNMREQVRSAIKMLSTRIEEHALYKHMGWKTLDDAAVYLHTGGAIGSKGHVATAVKLHPALTSYQLPKPAKKAEVRRAIKASMKLLDVAPDRITFPVYACIWRAILGSAPFSVHISGLTGTGKSQVAALAQQHFGAAMNADHLPASWSSTANAIEELAFEAKDALLTVDDFIPTGNQSDIQRQHKDADRLLRAQGNQAGRIRMNKDLSVRAARPPRGLILSTGEDVPGGQSLRARLIVVEMSPGDLNFNDGRRGRTLTDCQADAAEGLYAMSTAGFIKWLASRRVNAEKAMQQALIQFRQTSEKIAGHRRTPDNICNLMQGFYLWLQYATAAGAIGNEAARAKLWKRAVKALNDLIDFQSTNQTATDPVSQFIELVVSALTSGRAHLLQATGGPPPVNLAARSGWKPTGGQLTPQGQQIGWTNGAEIYLEPNSAFAVAQQLGKETGQFITLALSTLQRRLKQAGKLDSTDDARETVTIRRVCEGTTRSVLHFGAATLYPAAQPDKPDSAGLALVRPILEMDDLSEKPDNPTEHPTAEKPMNTRAKLANVGFVGFPKGSRGRVELGAKAAKPAAGAAKKTRQQMSGKPDKIVKNVLTKYALTCGFINGVYEVGAGFIANLVARCRLVYPEISDKELAHVARQCHLRDKARQTSAGLFLTTIPNELKQLDRRFNLATIKTPKPPKPTAADKAATRQAQAIARREEASQAQAETASKAEAEAAEQSKREAFQAQVAGMSPGDAHAESWLYRNATDPYQIWQRSILKTRAKADKNNGGQAATKGA